MQAVDALVDCLKEDNDEIVKHYAAKVMCMYVFCNNMCVCVLYYMCACVSVEYT